MEDALHLGCSATACGFKSHYPQFADMVELADTSDLSSGGSNTVRVQLPLSAGSCEAEG